MENVLYLFNEFIFPELIPILSKKLKPFGLSVNRGEKRDCFFCKEMETNAKLFSPSNEILTLMEALGFIITDTLKDRVIFRFDRDVCPYYMKTTLLIAPPLAPIPYGAKKEICLK